MVCFDVSSGRPRLCLLRPWLRKLQSFPSGHGIPCFFGLKGKPTGRLHLSGGPFKEHAQRVCRGVPPSHPESSVYQCSSLLCGISRKSNSVSSILVTCTLYILLTPWVCLQTGGAWHPLGTTMSQCPPKKIQLPHQTNGLGTQFG